MAKIVTLGEIMLRLSTVDNRRIINSTSFNATFGGAEANVAVCLSHFGHRTFFLTKLPNNLIGDSAKAALDKEGVDTSFIARGGTRLGTYYLETGSSLRASKVIYDRANSAISEASINDIEIAKALKGADIFHFSGITPALSEKAAKITEKACRIASKHGILVCCDLNFRKKLWTKEQARRVMVPLMQYVDVCIGNEEDADNCLGYKPDSDVIHGKTEVDGYKTILREMAEKFNFKYVATSLRESFNASHNGWKALLFDGNSFYESKHYDIYPIVDRVGSGDSFSAGLIHGLLKYGDKQKAIDFATACSALKHTIPGDFNQVSEEEVISLMEGDGSGRVQR